MKIQDSSFNGLKVTVGTKSVTHPRTHALTDTPKAICPINFFKVGGIMKACWSFLHYFHAAISNYLSEKPKICLVLYGPLTQV